MDRLTDNGNICDIAAVLYQMKKVWLFLWVGHGFPSLFVTTSWHISAQNRLIGLYLSMFLSVFLAIYPSILLSYDSYL